jgi:hypothetical protein
MSRISKLRESTETRLAIIEKHAFALETLLQEGQEEALHRLEILKGQLRERLTRSLTVFATLEGLPQETLLGLGFKLGRLFGVLEEGSVDTADTFSAQEKRIIVAIRDFGTYYDDKIKESITGLDEIEKEIFLVGLALEAEFETLSQCFKTKCSDMEADLTRNKDIILEKIEDVKTKIQVARDDPALATVKFMETLSADLAGIRSHFTGV